MNPIDLSKEELQLLRGLETLSRGNSATYWALVTLLPAAGVVFDPPKVSAVMKNLVDLGLADTRDGANWRISPQGKAYLSRR